jgi:hypothetical protein
MKIEPNRARCRRKENIIFRGGKEHCFRSDTETPGLVPFEVDQNTSDGIHIYSRNKESFYLLVVNCMLLSIWQPIAPEITYRQCHSIQLPDFYIDKFPTSASWERRNLSSQAEEPRFNPLAAPIAQ